MIPLCAEHGLAFQVFGPLAGGWLTGKYRRGAAPPEGSRMTMRPEPYTRFDSEAVYRSLEALEAAAAARGVSMAGLALAWLLAHPGVTLDRRRAADARAPRAGSRGALARAAHRTSATK